MDRHLQELLASRTTGLPHVGADLLELLEEAFPDKAVRPLSGNFVNAEAVVAACGYVEGARDVVDFVRGLVQKRIEGDADFTVKPRTIENEPEPTEGASTDPRRPGTRPSR